jgi:predicted glycosyltransferase
LKKKQHDFLISARDKDITHYLLNHYNIPFVSRGKGRQSFIGKFYNIITADIQLLKFAREFQPDIFLSFGSAYASHVSTLLRKPHIAFDDTENAVFEHIMYVPFTNIILTPQYFRKDFGQKHILFDGTMDSCYLNPKYFFAEDTVYDLLGLDKHEPYIIMRFVSWEAQKGLSNEDKRFLVNELSKFSKILISSEDKLPQELEAYKLNILPEKMHDALYFAIAYIGESTTMATESATLGTLSFCSNSRTKYFGIFDEFYKHNLITNIYNSDLKEIVKKISEFKNSEVLREKQKLNHSNYLKGKIDVTSFMVWFVENYPHSNKILKDNPHYQYKFAY